MRRQRSARLLLPLSGVGILIFLASLTPSPEAEGNTPTSQSGGTVRQGPLASLPSASGPHIERLKALGDDAWLNLGAPAADPQWGRALGRSWSPKMAYAPDLRGAFLTGEANHGWVNPRTRRQMDDLWFYDVNANRWVCAYPGTDTANLDTAYTINTDGFTATADGSPVPVTQLGHAYECVTYDTDLKRFVFMPQCVAYGPAGPLARRGKTEGSPWYFDTATGKWGGQATKGGYPQTPAFGDVAMYVPSRKQIFYHAFGSGRNNTFFYDPAANRWTEVKTAWTMAFKATDGSPPPPKGGDVIACYDAKRDRIYMARGKLLWYYDVKANTWVDPTPTGEFDAQATHDGAMNYDTANDRLVIISLGGSDSKAVHKVFVYDPQGNAFTTMPRAAPKEIAQMNVFYDQGLNIHFVHAAQDNRQGDMWAYRYKK